MYLGIHSKSERRRILKAQLKVAICHEWLDNIGGGEKVLLELSKLYDNPTVFTLWANKEITEKLDFPVKVSFLQHFPTKLRRTIGLFLMPFAWKTFESELKSFDLIINSSWAFAHSAGGNHPRKISYIHTPGRYWWYPSIDQRTKVRVPGFLLSIIRRKDFNLAQKTNVYVANSLETKKRILECWGRESEVVYPPVNLDFYKPSDFLSDRKDFILGVGRFVGYKNHEFVIRIGETLGKKVVLAGHGPLLESLKNQAANSTTEVEVIDSPSDFELRQLYYDAFCLIYPTFEDFGIVPVEAMGCGLQVLGLSQGGLIETVTNGIAGTLVDSIDLKTFVDGYHDLPNKSRDLIRDSVEKFSSSQFTIEIRVKISKNWAPHL